MEEVYKSTLVTKESENHALKEQLAEVNVMLKSHKMVPIKEVSKKKKKVKGGKQETDTHQHSQNHSRKNHKHVSSSSGNSNSVKNGSSSSKSSFEDK